jgi:hypothetical protein
MVNLIRKDGQKVLISYCKLPLQNTGDTLKEQDGMVHVTVHWVF